MKDFIEANYPARDREYWDLLVDVRVGESATWTLFDAIDAWNDTSVDCFGVMVWPYVYWYEPRIVRQLDWTALRSGDRASASNSVTIAPFDTIFVSANDHSSPEHTLREYRNHANNYPNTGYRVVTIGEVGSPGHQFHQMAVDLSYLGQEGSHPIPALLEDNLEFRFTTPETFRTDADPETVARLLFDDNVR